jgi:ELWxxDGT repeat protein
MMTMNQLHLNRLVAFALLLAAGPMTHAAHADIPRYLFGAAHAVEGINTPDTIEWAPAVSADELEMFFGRRNLDEDFDLYVSRRNSKDAPWGLPELVKELQTSDFDGQPSLSSDGLTLYYVNGNDAPNFDDLIVDVRSARRPTPTSPFEKPTILFGGPGEPPTVAPSISADELTLYAQRLDPVGRIADVYVSHRATTDDPWGELVPMPELSDPAKWQSRPHISSDGRTLFFYESNGWEQSNQAARGNGDLMMLVRSSDQSPWSEPINLGSAINSGSQEDFAHLSFDRRTLYFVRAVVANENGEIWQAPVLPFEAKAISGNGGDYAQDFDSLGTVFPAAGTALPTGWTFTANDVVFASATTSRFPARRRNYAGVYNAGMAGDTDRALVTDYSVDEGGELDFRAFVQDAPLQALRLGFDLEAWQIYSEVGANKGEAAFHVVIESDTGTGFSQLVDLGTVTTGATLSRPADAELVNGNHPADRVSYDSGPLDVHVPQGATLRVRWMSTAASQRTVVFGLDNVSLRFACPGDSNIDGLFNSTDLVQVFQRGEYEDTVVGNSTWSDGDWNSDHEFDSGDLVAAFQTGKYERAAEVTSSVPEPSNWISTLIAIPLLTATLRGRRSHRKRTVDSFSRYLQVEALEDRHLLAAMPRLVKDIDTITNPGSGPSDFTEVGGTVFFVASTPATGRELWKSDGTDAGTVRVKDINPGGVDYISEVFELSSKVLMNVNGTLYFSADDAINGLELWKSDGTEAGTTLFRDINPGSDWSFPGLQTVVNGTLFFSAGDGASGTELWKSDGTVAGTVRVKDINLGGYGSHPGSLTNVNGTLYFSACDKANGFQLWKSDGTDAGTIRVKVISPNVDTLYCFANSFGPSSLENVNGTLYFSTDDGTGRELWKSDGTEAGTVRIKDIRLGSSHPHSLTNVNGTLYFIADDAMNGLELWKSDGTEAGTVRVKDIRPGSEGGSLDLLTNVNGTLYFTADDGTSGSELWKSDGTESGTVRVKDIRRGNGMGTPLDMTNVNGRLYFSANDGIAGRELWTSDGTAAGTVMLADLAAGSVMDANDLCLRLAK